MRRILILALFVSVPASAAETITYTYDALGRLVQVQRSGSVNNGASATYAYDPANNRTNVTTTAPGGGGMARNQPVPNKDKDQNAGAANGAPRK